MKRKQLLSALLALIMLLSLLPVSSFAESDVEVPEAAVAEQIIDETPAEEVPAEEAVEEVPAVEETVEEVPAVEETVEEVPAVEEIVEEVPAVEETVEEPEVVEEPEEEPVVNAIVGQPQDLTVVNGERAVFSVEVTGNAVSFQWQSSRDNRRWSNLNAWYYGSDAELGFYPTRSDNGYYFRVVVTFENGEQLISEAARLSVVSVVITAQPQDLSVEPDSEAVFTGGPKGSIYYYQWQYSANGSRWSNLNTRYYGSSNTLRFIAEAEDDGLYIRALVYGRDGSRIATEAAKLTVAANELEPEVTYEARTLEPEVAVEGVALTVDAPEGALPSDAVLNIAAVDAAPYEELTKALLGDEVEIGYALDINFTTEADGEIKPNDDVVVYLTVPGISEKKDVSVVHFSDDGVATKLDLVPAEELPRALGTDEIAIKTKDFSVFELTWTVGEDEKSATIHFGTVTGGTFTEFEQTDISFDTTASSINLANTFSGYSFLGAVYCEAGGDYVSGVDIDTILYKGESGWNAYVTTRDDEDIPVTEFKPIAAGSDIYVVYYAPSAPVPSGSGDSTVPSPTTTKTVTPNADGTYTIQLDVAGATVTEDNSHYVNVLVILDATKSMNSGSKWTNAKLAMNTLVETLCEGENAANAGKIDFALVTFGLSATVVQNWTKDNVEFKKTCASQNMVSTTGTNWEAGLRGGLYGVLNKMPDDDPTYVIFLTDGDPNRYYTSDTGTNYDGTGIANGSNTTTAATRSQNEAYAIAHKPTQLYGIYCGTTTSTSDESYKRLNDVITGQGGVKTIAATADTIESEFKAIAETALAEIGANNVSVDDGVPSLSSVSATTAGEAGGFEYYIGTKAEGASEPTYQTWTDAPGASYSNDNGVTWDLSSVGTVSEGSYYRLKFTVWPSQDAYDLIADLNNGLVTKTDAELDALGIAQNEQGVYYLMTNTHLNTNYKVGNTSYSDSPDTLPTEEMILPTQTISVEKLWHNYLDNSHSDSDIDGLQLILIRDTKEYLEFDVDASTNWKKDNIYISCGQIAGGVLKESGHDYFVAEKAKQEIDKTEYWEADSPVYHPMVIDGKATMLILDEAATAEVAGTTYKIGDKYYTKNTDSSTMSAINERVSWLNLSKVVTGTGAPADAGFQYKVTITQPHTGRDIYFSVFGGGVSYRDDLDTTATETISDNHTYYVAKSGEEFTISNMQAGWNIRFLNLETDTTYTIKEVTDDMEPGFVFNSAEAVETLYQAKGTAADGYPKTVDAAKQEIDDTTVTDAVVSGKIHGTNTDYTVTYTNDYLGFFYVYHSSDCSVERIYLTDARVVDGEFNIFAETADGTLYGGYYDSYLGKSDGFDAAALTYTNNKAKDEGGTKYDVSYIKTSGKAAWNSPAKAYDVNGKAMTPSQNAVYFLKEVPTTYLLPYTYYTYYKADNKIADMWAISDLDDLNYTDAGFYIKNTKTSATSVVSALNIKAQNGTTTVKLTALKAFGAKGVKDGYLSYVKSSDYLNQDIVIWQYWKTIDGIEVCGTTQRSLNTVGDNGYKGKIVSSDTPYTAS